MAGASGYAPANCGDFDRKVRLVECNPPVRPEVAHGRKHLARFEQRAALRQDFHHYGQRHNG
jgi:hypothetical protein